MVLTAANSSLFSSTRMLYALSKSGDAPKLLDSINQRGVLILVLLATVAFGLGITMLGITVQEFTYKNTDI